MISNIKGRIFLVGCPRSGTTLLQSLVAAHPQITSFPESKFFLRLVYPESWRTRLGLTRIGIASARARPNLVQFLQDIGQQQMLKYLSPNIIFMEQYAKAFIKIIDELAIQQNKQFWLEKTPEHLHRIKYIEHFVPDAKFIHILRNGEDVVASLYEVSHKHPESWSGTWSLDKCINRWLKDVSISKEYQAKANHLIITYDAIIQDSELVLRQICSFLDIPFDKNIINSRCDAAKKIIRDRENWKQSVEGKIVNTSGVKFNKLFNVAQKKYIRKRLVSPDYQKIQQEYQKSIVNLV